MRPTGPVVAGVVGAIAFTAGWLSNLGPSTTLVVSLVCGLAAVFSQLSTRDLMARSQQLVDRGADKADDDAGELFEEACTMRNRISRVSMFTLICGALGPALATMATLKPHQFWPAAALAASLVAFFLSLLLFLGNQQLGKLIDEDRARRAAEALRKELTKGDHPVDPAKLEENPHLTGYAPRAPQK